MLDLIGSVVQIWAIGLIGHGWSFVIVVVRRLSPHVIYKGRDCMLGEQNGHALS
jgi:hypothetical protein